MNILEIAIPSNAAGIEQRSLKWNKDTLYYYIDGELIYLSEKKLKGFLNEMSKLTSIEFIPSYERYQSDIVVYFGSLDNYSTIYQIDIPELIKKQRNHWLSLKWSPAYNLINAFICINPFVIEYYNYGQYLLKKSLIQSLGLTGKSKSEHNILVGYPTETNSVLKKADKQFIKFHYHNNIPSGSSKKLIRNEILMNFDIDKFLKAKL